MSDGRARLTKAAFVALLFLLIAGSIVWLSQSGILGTGSASRGTVVSRLIEDPPTVRPDSSTTALDPSSASPSRAPAVAPSSPIAPITGLVLHRGAPLHDASIAYGPVGSAVASGQYVYADREGKFRIQPTRGDELQLVVSKDGYSTVQRLAKPGMDVTVELDSPDSVGSISGRLVDAASHVGVEEFKLDVMRKKGKHDVTGVLSRTIKGSDGYFHEPLPIALAEIDIDVLFAAKGYRDKYVPSLHVLQASHVDVGEVQIERIGGVRSGVVVDDRDGAPIAGAHVTPISDKGFAEDFVTTDAQGRFTLEHMRAKVLGGFVATADDFAPLYLDLQNDAGKQAGDAPVLRLKQGLTLRGKVVSSTIAPEKLLVGYWSDEVSDPFVGMPGIVKKLVAPNPAGEFALEHVPSRRVTVGVQQMVGQRMFRSVLYEHLFEIDCSDGQDRNVDFVLGQGAVLEAKLVNVPERAGMTATLVGADGSRLALIDTVGGGAITFSDVPRGNYVLRVASTKQRHLEVAVSVGNDKADLGDVDVSELLERR